MAKGKKSPRSDRKLILVLGMHRSGTSALTGVLAKLGVTLGKEMLPEAPDNPKGFFENKRVVAAHEKVLQSLARTWFDPRPLPAEWMTNSGVKQVQSELVGVLGELFTQGNPVVIKDPRSCRLVDLWVRVAQKVRARPSAILVIRSPQEVAGSLGRRDGLSAARVHLLWMRYLLDAERSTRGMDRCFVSYEALLRDWRAEISKVDRSLGTNFGSHARGGVAEEVKRFLDPSLRHGVPDGAVDSSPFEPLAVALQELALQYSADSGAADVYARFDAIEAALEPISAAYFAAIEDSIRRELPVAIEAERKRQQLDRASVDISLHLAALRELWRPARIARPLGQCQLYFRETNSGFTETHSISVESTPIDFGRSVRFDLPEDARVDFIRIDPDDAPGIFSVQSFTIGGVPLHDLAQRVTHVNELTLPVNSERARLRFASVGPDPFFEVDIRDLMAEATSPPVVVEMQFRAETVATELGEEMRDVGLGLQGNYQDLRRRQHELVDRVESVQQSLSSVDESTGAIRADLDLLAGAIQRIRSAMDEGLQAQRDETAQARLEVDQQLQAQRDETARVRLALDHGFQMQRDETAQARLEVDQQLQAQRDETAQVRNALQMEQAAIMSLRASLADGEQMQHDEFAMFHHMLQANQAQDAVMAAGIGSLREQQAILLEFARRRSPSYWWRRVSDWYRKPTVTAKDDSMRLDVVPLANVEREDRGEGEGFWLSMSEDPQFLLGSSDKVLEGGWYLFEADFERIEGLLMSPCLYPDYGSGFAEVERVPLPEPGDDGRIRTVILMKHPVNQLRFDPSTKPTRFRLSSVGLKRLSRTKALRCMLRVAAGPTRDWRRMISVLLSFARAALVGNLRKGGEAAYAKYQELLLPTAGDYLAWVRNYDTLSTVDGELLRQHVAGLVRQPLISILVPVYNTEERWLRRCLDSVLAQAYPNWELCVADDASPARHVRRTLEEYACRDSRIRVHFRERNGHISEATNSALALATGEYVALLDHDDELRPHSLLEMVKAINANPRWRLVYSDEDKIDSKGVRSSPYFKPDWNYELFLSQNFISHLGMYHTSLVRDVGGFRMGFEGAQDWDLALRCVEKLGPDEIGHVPKVLYHWRAIAGSTALGGDQKDYAGSAGKRAVDDHLRRLGQTARVEINQYGHLNVFRALSVPQRVSLIIPTRDKVGLLRMCVQSILDKTDYPDYELIIVDNQSNEAATFEYFQELESEPRVQVLSYNAPFNYSKINNYAAAHATGSIIGLVNNDIEVISPNWMMVMASQAVRQEIGAVGAMLYYPDDTIQHAGVVLGVGGVAGHAYTGLPAGATGQSGRALLAQEMSAVTGACLLVRKEIFEEVGGLDESLSVAFNDIDFCLRVLKAGYRNIWTPYAALYHHESASRGYEDTPEKIARFEREIKTMLSRWGDALLADPCYNSNLTLAGVPFELASPPR